MTRTVKLLAVLSVLLVAAPAAMAQYRANIYFGDGSGVELPNGVTLPEGTAVELVLWDAHQYPATQGTFISFVNIQLGDSSPGLNLGTAGTWVWEPALLTGISMLASDADLSDGHVGAFGTAQSFIPAPPVKLGTLTFDTPAYVPAGSNNYIVALTGGIAEDTETSVGGGTSFSGASAGNITLGEYQFTVMPEPATMALLGLGGAALLFRRKR